MQGTMIRKLPQDSEQTVNDALWGIHDHLGRSAQELGRIADRLAVKVDEDGYIDIRASNASTTSLTLRTLLASVNPAPAAIATVLYSIAGTNATGATFTIGDRVIFVQVGASIAMPQSLPLSEAGALILNPGDVITLALNGASPTAVAMYFEFCGKLLAPRKSYSIYR